MCIGCMSDVGHILTAHKKLDTSKSGTHTRSFGKPMYFWSGSKPFEHIPIYYAIIQEMSLNVTLVLIEIWERSLLYKVGSLSHYVRRVSCSVAHILSVVVILEFQLSKKVSHSSEQTIILPPTCKRKHIKRERERGRVQQNYIACDDLTYVQQHQIHSWVFVQLEVF